MEESAASARAMELVREGFALHQAGRAAEAASLYDRALALAPGLVDALHLRGVAACQAGRHAEGLPFLERAVAARPEDAAARGNLVLARFGVARALREAGRLEEALAAYDELVALAPEHAAGQFNRANLLRQMGQLEAAAAGYGAALALKPHDAAALLNRGSTHLALRRGAEALADFAQAAALAPDDPVPAVNRGAALRAMGRLAEALAGAEAAVARFPGHAAAWDLLGVLLADLKRRDEAVAALERAVALAPKAADVRGHLAGTLRDLGRLEEALAEYERALARDAPAGHLAGKAGVLMDMGRGEAALAAFDAAIARDPGHVEAHGFRSLALLAMGHWQEGWAEYEWRGRIPGSLVERFGPAGRWRGEVPVSGRRLFLFWEQGLGDTIQFLRFAPAMQARGAEVVLSVQDSLLPLVRGFAPGLAVVGEATRPGNGDLHCPLMSLPMVLGIGPGDVPAAGGYLAADPARVAAWRERVEAPRRPRVGLALSGNPQHANDRNRSLPFAALAGLLGAEVDWLCLQQEVRAEERAALETDGRVRFVGDGIADFADTAALVAHCDLVIAVDTSVAHLAGAMGRPVWVLLPTPADWRWGIEGERSPWYAGARLFRRPRGGSWADVAARVRVALEAWRTRGLCGRIAARDGWPSGLRQRS